MKMRDCPKFNTCSAPICILDAEWPERVHHNENVCCFYLLESQKRDAKAIFRGAGLEELFAIAIAVAPAIAARHAPIRRNLERSKETGSRMNRFRSEVKYDHENND
jgi:hypothetical protein